MSEVSELRVSLTVDDFDQALVFYRDALGLDQLADWSSDSGRVVALAAGRATLELFDQAQAASVDRIEAGARVSGPVRLALEVADSEGVASRLVDAGAERVAPPVLTPWGDRNARVRAPDGMQLTLFTVSAEDPPKLDDVEVERRYREMLAGWNARRGSAFAEPLTSDAVIIGFDGSRHAGRDVIAADMDRIFADHETATYVAKVRSLQRLTDDVAVVHAVAGMVPPGGSDVMPDRNAVHTALLVKRDDRWRIAHFQNTPAQFHGRPELADGLTAELRQELATGQ